MIYLEFGEAWRVDQRKRRFTIYYPDGSSVLVADGDVTMLIPSISLRLADIGA